MTTMDTSKPANSDNTDDGNDAIQDVKKALQERLDVDHDFLLTGTTVDEGVNASADDVGKHKKVSFVEPYGGGAGENPEPVDATFEGILYTKKDGGDGNAALFYNADDVSAIQITTDDAGTGYLNVPVTAPLEINTQSVALKTGGAATGILVDHIATGDGDFVDGTTIETKGSGNGIGVLEPTTPAAIPTGGAGAGAGDMAGVAVFACGHYTGHANNQTVDTELTIYHLVIKRTDAETTAFEAIVGNATEVWGQGEGQDQNSAVSISSSSFTVTGAVAHVNLENKTYLWFAIGKRP